MRMLPQLQAERQLSAIEATSVPHMKDDARASVFRRYSRQRDGEGPAKARSAVEALTQAGIPIVEVPKAAKRVPADDGTRRDKTEGKP